jgi:hypothetical protein
VFRKLVLPSSRMPPFLFNEVLFFILRAVAQVATESKRVLLAW